MLWCETAGTDVADFEALAVCVDQFTRAGIPACVDVRSIPRGLPRNAQFDLAPAQRDGPPPPGATVALIAAQRLSDARLMALRRLAGSEPRSAVAFGRFESEQATIGLRARLSYVFGRDPEVIDTGGRGPLGDLGAEWPVFGVARPVAALPTRPRLLVVGPDLTEPREQAALAGLALTRSLTAAILTDGKAKKAWVTAEGALLPAYHYGEVLPAGLAGRVDICAVFASPARNYRLQCLIADLAVSGAALVDCTPQHTLAGPSDAFLRGPRDLAGLAAFVATEVLPNHAAINAQVRGSATAQAFARMPLSAASEPLRRAPRAVRPERKRIVFMPTNGVGLGHARRCTLVAAGLDRARVEPVFAVFPSCMGLVRGCGFDTMPLVSRSALHAQGHEPDLTNALRLRSLTAGAAALVFDGGYVFDSVYRTALETRVPAIWIRRGLWQAHQDNRVPLDREKAFARVIVPLEAFDDLNAAYSRGEYLCPVGPITRRADLDAASRTALRAALAERYGRPFERLVLTQLGGGVAADRSAQIQAIAGMLERRDDVLHLVLVWPGGAVHPAWFGWRATRVVRTHHAGTLAAAADLVVSAAGYNAFHETLYGALPTIFVPQTGGYMDDQSARARAAQERGLAGLVEPHALMTLEREIGRWLDGDAAAQARVRLAALDLPPTGNARAARLIEEMMDADAALDDADRADRPAGRG